jgi:hypothetical protein
MKKTVLALLGLSLGGTAGAVELTRPELPAYFGGSIGTTRYEWKNPGFDLGGNRLCPPAVSRCEDSPLGFKLFAGYMLSRTIGLEGAYYYMGDANLEYGAVDDQGNPVTVHQGLLMDGFALSAVFTAPLGPVSLNARLGIAASRIRRDDALDGVTINKAEKTRAEPFFGIGGAYHLLPQFSVRLDWDRARGQTDLKEKFDVDLFTLGVQYRY